LVSFAVLIKTQSVQVDVLEPWIVGVTLFAAVADFRRVMLAIFFDVDGVHIVGVESLSTAIAGAEVARWVGDES
jgi:hypothetical protein